MVSGIKYNDYLSSTEISTTITNILARVNRDLPMLSDFDLHEAGIDETLWQRITTGSGAVTRDLSGGYASAYLATGGVAGSTSRLDSRQRFSCIPTLIGTNSVIKKLIVEWEARFVNVPNINPIVFFMGVVDWVTGDGIVFYLDPALFLAGVVWAGGGSLPRFLSSPPTLTNWNKYRFEVYSNRIDWIINETIQATATLVPALPAQMMPFSAIIGNVAAANAGIYIAKRQVWYEVEE